MNRDPELTTRNLNRQVGDTALDNIAMLQAQVPRRAGLAFGQLVTPHRDAPLRDPDTDRQLLVPVSSDSTVKLPVLTLGAAEVPCLI